ESGTRHEGDAADAQAGHQGSYGANFNPHCHAIISDGVWSAEGEFLELPSLDTAAVCELFRRLLLRRLHKEERLSERFTENLLSWVHPGFSLFAGEPLSPEDAGQLGAARAMPASSRRFSRWILSCVSAAQR